ncbi:MAG: polysaccharide deacetylase family protein [Isosphaeraceae bacterium]
MTRPSPHSTERVHPREATFLKSVSSHPRDKDAPPRPPQPNPGARLSVRMLSRIQKLVRTADGFVARAYLRVVNEKPALLAFLFHSLFHDEEEITRNHVDPLDRTTVARFREVVAYYASHGYQFVGPDRIAQGLESGGRYVALTFDDGYFNNTRALPVLEEFQVPATFMISTDHVRRNRCFWWDALHREMVARGATIEDVARESLRLKAKRDDQIEAELKARYGPGVSTPRSDVDRPFTPAELREFARHPLVHVGNHTVSHAILTNYPENEARRQIAKAQASLIEFTGVQPIAIAYPNGAFTPRIEELCRELGLKVGFTIRPEKNRTPLDSDDPRLLHLGRFTPHSQDTIVNQCRTYRSDLQLYGSLRGNYVRFCRNGFSN